MAEHRTVPELMEENDVVDLLIRQHALIRDMFDEVEKASGTERGEAFQRLVRMLAVHETAEEEIVHPYARRKLEGGDAVVDDRLAEEHEAKKLLMEMDKAGPEDSRFMTNLAVLRASVLAHARSEERYEFTQLRARTSETERRAMAAGLKAAEAMAPTHPHPGVESATKNLLIGTPVAMMDRVRDAIRNAMGKDG
ncbi:hemerythrin domain-containing protein [Planomonospora parontospora]|uniref:hemerythrin domain-containing protein n=1 Tax=Planomonospora parontospora TaxID=58119 RepID=UPI001991A2DE|nr:hemerythrin domain-containing protein [Planomonospora parontospora]GGL25472.1 hemerythrin [Planomonospora parontospora subsp. antibiotica]GII16334.1 hemerythrin [Planomonospora parontospora subsp. antibiotica]